MSAHVLDFPHKRETRYLPVTETAKIIRQALKEAFPEVKFSITSKKYSGGSSIDVRWTDGPHRDLVEAVAKAFQGGYFDGMTDYKGGHVHEYEGELVHFGGDFVFCTREISAEVMAKGVAILAPLDADGLEQMSFKFNLQNAFNKAYDKAERLAWLILHNCPTPQFEGRTSPTADKPKIVRSY